MLQLILTNRWWLSSALSKSPLEITVTRLDKYHMGKSSSIRSSWTNNKRTVIKLVHPTELQTRIQYKIRQATRIANPTLLKTSNTPRTSQISSQAGSRSSLSAANQLRSTKARLTLTMTTKWFQYHEPKTWPITKPRCIIRVLAKQEVLPHLSLIVRSAFT